MTTEEDYLKYGPLISPLMEELFKEISTTLHKLFVKGKVEGIPIQYLESAEGFIIYKALVASITTREDGCPSCVMKTLGSHHHAQLRFLSEHLNKLTETFEGHTCDIEDPRVTHSEPGHA